MDDFFAFAVIVGLAWWTGRRARKSGRNRWRWTIASLIFPVFATLILLSSQRFPWLLHGPGSYEDRLFWWRVPKQARTALARARELESDYKRVTRENSRLHNRDSYQRAKLREVDSPHGRQLMRSGRVVVHELWISTPVWQGPIDGVKATVVDDSQVVQRLTLTRFAVAGPLSVFAPKRKTIGNARILIEGPHFSYSAVPLSQGKDAAQREAYRLADAINNAGIRAGDVRRQREAVAGHRTLGSEPPPRLIIDQVEHRHKLLRNFVDGQPSEVRDILLRRIPAAGRRLNYMEQESVDLPPPAL